MGFWANLTPTELAALKRHHATPKRRSPGKEPCRVCGFEDTRGRCIQCHRPICDGCAQKAHHRQCPDCEPRSPRTIPS